MNTSDKCYWCGGIESNFYHLRCAVEMSKSNNSEYKKTVLMYQETNKRLREALEEIVVISHHRFPNVDASDNCRDVAKKALFHVEPNIRDL